MKKKNAGVSSFKFAFHVLCCVMGRQEIMCFMIWFNVMNVTEVAYNKMLGFSVCIILN